MGHDPLTTKKKKLQDSALPVSWEVYYLEPWLKVTTETVRGEVYKNP